MFKNDSDSDRMDYLDEPFVEVEMKNSIIIVKPGNLDEEIKKDDNSIKIKDIINENSDESTKATPDESMLNS